MTTHTPTPLEVRLAWLIPGILLASLWINYSIANASRLDVDQFAPVVLRPSRLANYGRDVADLSFPAVDPGLFNQVLQDQAISSSGQSITPPSPSQPASNSSPTPQASGTPRSGQPSATPQPGVTLPVVLPVLPTTIGIIPTVIGVVPPVIDIVSTAVDTTSNTAEDVVSGASDVVSTTVANVCERLLLGLCRP